MANLDLPIELFEEPEAFAAWIVANPEADGVWLKFAKKASGIKSINYDQALKIGLCYGWIDSVVNKFDDSFYIQKFTPRRAKSIWSVRNKLLVAELTKEGKMQPSGQAQIDTAKADGRWDAAYESQSNAELPADLLAEVEKRPNAKAFLATISKSNRFTIYYRLHSAKKPETRERRFKQIIEMLENGEVFHQ